MTYSLQKASIWKRFSAFVFDAVILFTLAIGIMAIVSAIIGYSDTSATYETIESIHKKDVEDKYKEFGISFDKPRESYEGEQLEKYEQAVKELNKNRQNDPLLGHYYTLLVSKTMVIVALGLMIAFIALEFVVPLFFKNGRTLGKKIFGIAVMHTNGVKIKSITLFIRAILMKYAIETMIPVSVLLQFMFGSGGMLSAILTLAIFATQIIMLIATKTNSALHDGFCSTVVVDYATQRIFDSEDELIEYKRQQAARIAEERRD